MNEYVRRYVVRMLGVACFAIGAVAQLPLNKVSPSEIWNHRLNPEPLIRVDDSKRRPFDSVTVSVVVAADGHVRSARIEMNASSEYAPRALAMVKELHYRPFLRDGVPAEVEFYEWVRILPLEKIPAKHVPFPKVDDLGTVQFSLERGPCFGPCPAYELRISGDGAVSYVGKSNVGALGAQSDRVPAESVQRLLRSFEEADFFSLDNRYEIGVTDSPRFMIGLKIGAAKKTIVDYVGDQVGMPASVRKLEDEIDGVASSAKWVQEFLLVKPRP